MCKHRQKGHKDLSKHFFKTKLTRFIHFCLLIFEGDGVRNPSIDGVEGYTVNIDLPKSKGGKRDIFVCYLLKCTMLDVLQLLVKLHSLPFSLLNSNAKVGEKLF